MCVCVLDGRVADVRSLYVRKCGAQTVRFYLCLLSPHRMEWIGRTTGDVDLGSERQLGCIVKGYGGWLLGEQRIDIIQITCNTQTSGH